MKGRWHDWFNYFRKTREAVDLGPHPDFGNATSDAAANMRRLEKRARAKVDQICLEWIKTGKWPVMTDRERWFTRLRFSAAQLLLLVLMSPGAGAFRLVPSRKTKRTDMLRWFLVDTWPFSAHPTLGCDAILPPKPPSSFVRSHN